MIENEITQEQRIRLSTRNTQDFLGRFVIIDGTWIHHFTLELNWQSAEQHVTSESHLKCRKMCNSQLS